MDPSEAVKQIVSGAEGRGDAVFLSVIVIVLCGVIMCGAGYILIRWMPALLQNFREEMRMEREYHQKQIDSLIASAEKSTDRITSSISKIK